MAEENESQNHDDQVVVDCASSKVSDLWKLEDCWSIWLGFLILIVGLIIYLPQGTEEVNIKINESNKILQRESESAPFKTTAWYIALDTKAKLKATSTGIGKKIKKLTGKPKKWKSNPLNAFFRGEKEADLLKQNAEENYLDSKDKESDAFELAKLAEAEAAAFNYTDEELNLKAITAIDNWRSTVKITSVEKKKAGVKPFNQIPYLILFMMILAIFFGIGLKIMGNSIWKFVLGFSFVFLIAVLAYTIACNSTMSHYGIGYPGWAILFGLIISNTIGTPKWVKPAVQTEYFIKTGLVLLGAEILFGKILSIGIPGIFVAWVVTPIVLITTFWFGQKIIKIPSKTLNITISADMSVCGVSAAIATAAACRAKKEELTLAVGMSLIFTSIMMIVMPAIIKAVGIPYILGGAWMGGTIDATGAVAAAGAFLSDRALYVAATIKMIQNVLIGIVAFCVALYWVTKVDRKKGQKVSALEIWYRFPKFVLGFIVASIIFSLIYQYLGNDMAYVVIDHGAIRGFSKIFRGWFFCLAFVSIGLATDFRELKNYFKGGKPLILYICGQTFNLILTLIMAYIMFYIVFPEITALI
jgi:uncharacterized membrane protein YadS